MPFTSGLLLSTALLSLLYAWQARRSPATYRRPLQLFYYSQACLLLFLSLDKQWGLLHRLTSYSRIIAMRDGWYYSRHSLQVELIVVMIVAGLLLLGVASWCFRAILRQQWLPLLSAIGLLTYVVIRAISLHDIDALLAARVWGLRRDWLVELGGSLFLLCALTLAFSVQQRRSRHWRSPDEPRPRRIVSSG